MKRLALVLPAIATLAGCISESPAPGPDPAPSGPVYEIDPRALDREVELVRPVPQIDPVLLESR